MRPAFSVLLLVLLFLPDAPRAQVEISWDRDLAFEWDRENYEKLLRDVVRSSQEEVSAWLGLSLDRPLLVRVLTRARYEAQFGSAAAWNRGAHYHQGAIHVNGGARLDGRFAGLMAHEMTHAILDHRGTAGGLPVWLNEGLAERARHRKQGAHDLDTTQVTQLEVALEQRQLLPLPRNPWLSPFEYLQSYAVVLFLEKKLGKDALLRIVKRTLAGTPFEKALDAEVRWTMKEVEEGFRYWVDHLQ